MDSNQTFASVITSFGGSVMSPDAVRDVVEAVRSRKRRTLDGVGGESVVANDIPKPVGYKKVGINKPLSLTIEHCYLGEYPGIGSKKPVLVTSSFKDEGDFPAAPRAVNAVNKSKRDRQSIDFAANEDGTRIVYYSPALSENRFTYTVEITIDRFNNAAAGSLSKILATAGGLPVFTIGTQFALVAASQVVKIGADFIEGAIDGKPYFANSKEITFDIAGHTDTRANRLIITHAHNKEEIESTLTFATSGFELVDRKTGKPYRGDLPYIILSIDGHAKPALKEWKPTAATSAQLTQFLNPDSSHERRVDAIHAGLKLYSDVKIRGRIKDQEAILKGMKEGTPEHTDIKEKIAALKAQLLTDEIKAIVK